MQGTCMYNGGLFQVLQVFVRPEPVYQSSKLSYYSQARMGMPSSGYREKSENRERKEEIPASDTGVVSALAISSVDQ